MRAFDAQTDGRRNEALTTLAAALCDKLGREYDTNDLRPIRPNREIEENKWSAQRYGMNGTFTDHRSHANVETRRAVHDLIDDLHENPERDLAPLALLLDEPTESERQLEVWHATNSVLEVARDVAERTRSTAG